MGCTRRRRGEAAELDGDAGGVSAALSLLHPKSNSSDEASPSMMATLSGDERTGEGYSVRLLATARAGLRIEAAAFLPSPKIEVRWSGGWGRPGPVRVRRRVRG